MHLAHFCADIHTLRGSLDEAAGKWGVRVNRVELRQIEAPALLQAETEREIADIMARGKQDAAQASAVPSQQRVEPRPVHHPLRG